MRLELHTQLHLLHSLCDGLPFFNRQELARPVALLHVHKCSTTGTTVLVLFIMEVVKFVQLIHSFNPRNRKNFLGSLLTLCFHIDCQGRLDFLLLPATARQCQKNCGKNWTARIICMMMRLLTCCSPFRAPVLLTLRFRKVGRINIYCWWWQLPCPTKFVRKLAVTKGSRKWQFAWATF